MLKDTMLKNAGLISTDYFNNRVLLGSMDEEEGLRVEEEDVLYFWDGELNFKAILKLFY